VCRSCIFGTRVGPVCVCLSVCVGLEHMCFGVHVTVGLVHL